MTCCKCQLINMSDFVSRVALPESIDGKKVNIAIQETRFIIEKYICDDLYNELCDQIDADDLSPLNEELLCMIKDIWVRYAYGELYSLNVMTLSKENVVRKFSEASEPVSFSEAEKMANYWRMKAENYISTMVKFLKDNEAENVLYQGCNNCDNDDKRSGTSFWGIA